MSALLTAACPKDAAPTETTASSTSETTASSTSETTVSSPTEDTASSTSGAGTTVGDGSTTGPAVCEPPPAGTSDCCCFSTQEQGEGIAIENACPAPLLCGKLEIQCPEGAADCPLAENEELGEFMVSDEKALDCILTALRDGTEGSLKWEYTGAGVPGLSFYYRTVHILPDRQAFTDVLKGADLGGEWSDVTRQGLAPADDFAACLAAATVRERAACLLAPTDGNVLAVCTEGGYYDNFL